MAADTPARRARIAATHAWAADMETQARARGLTLNAVCVLAGVTRSAPNRWRAGKLPHKSVVDKIHAVLDRTPMLNPELEGLLQ